MRRAKLFLSIGIVSGGICLLIFGVAKLHIPPFKTISELRDIQESSDELVLQYVPEHIDPGSVRVPILIYHNVRPDYPAELSSAKSFSITPAMLDQQFAFLRTQGYTVISMSQLSADMKAGTTSPIRKPIVLNFDDGWESQFLYAYPLLQKYGYTATFFIYTNAINNYSSYMTWSQLHTLQQNGMEIGDHTMSHPHISQLNAAQLTYEVAGSKQLLESRLGIRVVDFASPYGYTDAALQDVLRQQGFDTGRTTYFGSYQSATHPYNLHGLLVGRSFGRFKWYVTGSITSY